MLENPADHAISQAKKVVMNLLTAPFTDII
jgi:hypothetical protein